MMHFIARLRDLSGGKPVGFKLCIGHAWEFMAICKAMLDTGIRPDFIVIDGSEGGTGAAPLEFVDHVGTPLREGLVLAHNCLVGTGLRQSIRLGASGRIVTGFDIARLLALGADWCNAARGFMFALGCIQAQTCHTDRCPTGVTTQNPWRQRALVVGDKAPRVYQFHQSTLAALGDLVGASGLAHPNELRPMHILKRISPSEVKSFAEVYTFLGHRELLAGTGNQQYAEQWALADAHGICTAAAHAVGGLTMVGSAIHLQCHEFEASAAHSLPLKTGGSGWGSLDVLNMTPTRPPRLRVVGRSPPFSARPKRTASASRRVRCGNASRA